jgi:hypothetical protein
MSADFSLLPVGQTDDQIGVSDRAQSDSEEVAAVVSAAADNLIRPFYIFHMYIIISTCCFINRYTLDNKIKFSPQNFFFLFFYCWFLS